MSSTLPESLTWPTSCWAQADFGEPPAHQPWLGTRVAYNICVNGRTWSSWCIKHAWIHCDRFPGSLSVDRLNRAAWVTRGPAPRLYERLPRSNRKQSILRHPALWTAGVNCGHPVCAGFQEPHSWTHARTGWVRIKIVDSLFYAKSAMCLSQPWIDDPQWGSTNLL